MFPQSDAAEAPKDQVMIQVVHGVPDGHVPDNMTVRIQDVVRPGPHLPHHSDHDPHPLVLVPGGGTYGSLTTCPPFLPLTDPLQFPRPAPLLLGP